ncbi:MAG: hypothetical protein ACRD0D_14110 [Acidimicrobiales bacterium]
MNLLAAKVWHYWLSFALLIPALVAVVFTAIGYLVKVKATRYPRR